MEQTLSVVEEIAQNASEASISLRRASAALKNQALSAVQKLLDSRHAEVIAANQRDISATKIQVEKGNISETLLKRLDICGVNQTKYRQLLQGLLDVQELDDPTGKVLLATQISVGLELYRVTCPIGVICVIFEARPEVVIQITALALKSGNAVILKGGKEASHTNSVLVQIVQDALDTVQGIPKHSVQYISSREEVAQLLSMEKYIDLVIPRGSNALVKYVKEQTRIPVLGHADGICSIYVDNQADISLGVDVLIDSKTQYVAACNSAETLLLHIDIARDFLLHLSQELKKQSKTIEFRADKESIIHFPPQVPVKLASPTDYDTEFLDNILAVKVIDSLGTAIQHINAHGSHHTDAIITTCRSVSFFVFISTRKENAMMFIDIKCQFIHRKHWNLWHKLTPQEFTTMHPLDLQTVFDMDLEPK
eukprot:Sdes_comp18417_c0_seq2m8312